MSGRHSPKWIKPGDVNTELLYGGDGHQRAARFYARSGYSRGGALPWEDAPPEIRALCLRLASDESIRKSMRLDSAELPTTKPPTTGWRHFVDEHPIATYLTAMAVIVLVATIVVLMAGGGA